MTIHSSPLPRFGTLHISIPLIEGVNPHSIVNNLPGPVQVNLEDQTLEMIAEKDEIHPYPKGKNFNFDSFSLAVKKVALIQESNRFEFVIDESKMPLSFLKAFLEGIFRITHNTKLVRPPYHAIYAITDVPQNLERAYGILIDYLGEKIFQEQQGFRGEQWPLYEAIKFKKKLEVPYVSSAFPHDVYTKETHLNAHN